MSKNDTFYELFFRIGAMKQPGANYVFSESAIANRKFHKTTFISFPRDKRFNTMSQGFRLNRLIESYQLKQIFNYELAIARLTKITVSAAKNNIR